MKFCIPDPYKDSSGIYQIVNVSNGKFYIGSTHCFKKRHRSHLVCLRNESHRTVHLLHAWHKHGYESFEMRLVELCAETGLKDREQFYLDTLRPYDPEVGYNHLAVSEISRDHALTRSRMSRAQTGRVLSRETKEKIRESLRGRGPSRDHILRMHAVQRENGLTEIHCRNISKAKKGKCTERMRESILLVHFKKKRVSDKTMLRAIAAVMSGTVPTRVERSLGLRKGALPEALDLSRKALGTFTPLLHAIGYLDSGANTYRDLVDPDIQAKINLNIEFPAGKDNLIEDPDEFLSFLTNLGLHNGTDL